jgi:hypothetical protein
LATCRGAGDGDSDALMALGPRLAAGGVPVVLAMQGDIAPSTHTRFMQEFLRELTATGLIDRAAALARSAVRREPDWWRPALFTRFKDGRIWYVPELAEKGSALGNWPAIVRHIRRGHCTPILGHGMIEALVGSRREIARGWAEQFNFPLAPHGREELPQVAQYLTIGQNPLFPYEELGDHVRKALCRRFDLDPKQAAGTSLDQLVSLVGEELRERNPFEPHLILAQQAFPIYVTANADNLLVEALEALGKRPVVEVCNWKLSTERPPSIFDQEPDYTPSVERPLVFYLFGKLDDPISLVLTEDDYFDYLIAISRYKELIPTSVRKVLANTMLLFVGFQLDDWTFRVLWRCILSQGGRESLRLYAHVAVQITPEEGRQLDPHLARDYLENYLHEPLRVRIYWGDTDDFLGELVDHLAAEG